jgi:hypothetical protein
MAGACTHAPAIRKPFLSPVDCFQIVAKDDLMFDFDNSADKILASLPATRETNFESAQSVPALRGEGTFWHCFCA